MDEVPKIILPEYQSLKEIIEFLRRLPDANLPILRYLGVRTYCSKCNHVHHYNQETSFSPGHCATTYPFECQCTIGEAPILFPFNDRRINPLNLEEVWAKLRVMGYKP